METESKTGSQPKDTQIKPIASNNEGQQDQTGDNLQNSLLYNEYKSTLLEPKNPKEQSVLGKSEGMKAISELINELDMDPLETEREGSK